VARPDAEVARGELLVECSDPLLVAQLEVLRARVDELKSRHDAAMASDAAQSRIVQEELQFALAAVSRAEERLGDLEIRSLTSGRFILPGAEDLPGRYLEQGALLGYVLDVERPTIRAVVPQDAVDLVRQRTRRVEVRLAERLRRVFTAVIRRELPGAVDHLPSVALGKAGGGRFAVDPREAGGTTALQPLFQFDLELDESPDALFVGGRAHVIFDHGYEPIGLQLFRRARQVFLKRFNV
jgi:putative peptide zinc metalloprotease protein